MFPVWRVVLVGQTIVSRVLLHEKHEGADFLVMRSRLLDSAVNVEALGSF